MEHIYTQRKRETSKYHQNRNKEIDKTKKILLPEKSKTIKLEKEYEGLKVNNKQ